MALIKQKLNILLYICRESQLRNN